MSKVNYKNMRIVRFQTIIKHHTGPMSSLYIFTIVLNQIQVALDVTVAAYEDVLADLGKHHLP